MSKKKTIIQGHKNNFETLKQAFNDRAVCLIDCIERSTGEHVAVICAIDKTNVDEFAFTPFARFFNGNPYEILVSPNDPEYASFSKPKKAELYAIKLEHAKEVWAEYIDQMPGNKYDGEFIPWCSERQKMREQFQSLVIQGEEVRAHLRKAIENLPDVGGVRKVGPNCCVVSSSLLASHNNWSPSYWLSAETKRVLLGVVDSQRPVSGLIKAMDDIVLTGQIKNSYGHIEAIAPDVLAELRRVWVER